MYLFRGRSHSDEGSSAPPRADGKPTLVASPAPPRPPRSLSRPSTASSTSSASSRRVCPHPPPTLVDTLYAPSDVPYGPVDRPSPVRSPSPITLHNLHSDPNTNLTANANASPLPPANEIDEDPTWSPSSRFTTPSTQFSTPTLPTHGAPSELSGITALTSSMSISKREPAELLTFAFGDSMAYVPSGKTYDEAIDHALDAFPALHAYDRSHITLAVSGRANKRVRVPRLAWAELVLDLRKYEIVHVQVDEDRPPSYKPKRSGVVGWVKEVVRWRRRDGSRRLAVGPVVPVTVRA